MSSHNGDDEEKKDDRPNIIKQAAAWTELLHGEQMSETERVDFHAWLKEPRNAEALFGIRTMVERLKSLPERLIRKRFQKALADDAASASSKIVSPPGYTLAHVAKFFLTRNAYRAYVEPVIADMQEEYIEAVAAGHRWRTWWIAIRGHLLIIPGWVYALVAGKLATLLRRRR